MVIEHLVLQTKYTFIETSYLYDCNLSRTIAIFFQLYLLLLLSSLKVKYSQLIQIDPILIIFFPGCSAQFFTHRLIPLRSMNIDKPSWRSSIHTFLKKNY